MSDAPIKSQNSGGVPITGQPAMGQPTVKPDYQQMYGVGGKFKDQLEAIAGTFGGRRSGGVETESFSAEASRGKAPEDMTEIPTEPETEKKPEFLGYLERVEREPKIQKPITDDYTRQVLLKSNTPTNVKVKLPLTAGEVQTGLHHKVWESIRWLAEWCVRQVKLLGARAEYKTEEAAAEG